MRRRTRMGHGLLVALGALAGAPLALAAQSAFAPMPQGELRLEVAATPAAGVSAGLGVNVRAGYYARVGVHAMAGLARRGEGFIGVQRVEAVSRFLFDPFGEFPRGLYGGGGFAVRRTPGDPVRGDLVVVVGVEGRRTAQPTIPSVELALGGGARLTVVLRRRRPTGR